MTASRSMRPHPAPGRLRLIQELLNTRKLETGKDTLSDPRALAEWLSSRHLLAADEALDETAWRDMLTIREGLRALVERNSGRKLAAGAVDRLDAAFRDVRPRLRFTRAGGLELVIVESGWHGVLARLLLLVFEEMRADRWTRLKACHDAGCRLVFYDSSPNRIGKWCNARRCGNRHNTRRYRKRGPAWEKGRLSFKAH